MWGVYPHEINWLFLWGRSVVHRWGASGPNLQLVTDKWKQREIYIAENIDELKQNIAFGRGDHLDTLTYLSDCNADNSQNILVGCE